MVGNLQSQERVKQICESEASLGYRRRFCLQKEKENPKPGSAFSSTFSYPLSFKKIWMLFKNKVEHEPRSKDGRLREERRIAGYGPPKQKGRSSKQGTLVDFFTNPVFFLVFASVGVL